MAVERPWIIHAAVAAEAVIGTSCWWRRGAPAPRSGWLRFAGIVGVHARRLVRGLSLAKHVSSASRRASEA
ncbi:MAG: hypothetical protein ACLRG2_05725 [Pauljensenia sp.]